MYEKRKYGSKVRYRVTPAMTNRQAKGKATEIRNQLGHGCQIDTWEGQYAVWCDKPIKSFPRTKSSPKAKRDSPLKRDMKKASRMVSANKGRSVDNPISTDTDFVVSELIGPDAKSYKTVHASRSKATARKMVKLQQKKFAADAVYVYYFTNRRLWVIYVKIGFGPDEPEPEWEPDPPKGRKGPRKRDKIPKGGISTKQKQEMFKFLDELRDSGKVNMFGAPAILAEAFGISQKQATAVWSEWAQEFKRGKTTRPKRSDTEVPQTYTDKRGTFQWVGSAKTKPEAKDFARGFKRKWSKAIFYNEKIGGRWIIYAIRKPEAKSRPKKRQLKSPIKVVPSSKLPLGINVIMECREGTSKKFWGWHIPPPTRGRNIVDLYWGRIDAKTMRTQQRKFGTKEELEDFLSKKFNEKQRKGYKVSR